jgi:hypothetical protein
MFWNEVWFSFVVRNQDSQVQQSREDFRWLEIFPKHYQRQINADQ